MMVRVYPEGESYKARAYSLTPKSAVESYCGAGHPGQYPGPLVAEPVDEEAHALPGWSADEDGKFRLFKVRTVVEWEATEVSQ